MDLTPPLGMTGNKQPQLWAVGLSLGFASFIVTTLRVYTRVAIIRSFGKDDALIVIAELLAIVFLVLLLVLATNGAGRHLEDVSPKELVTFVQVMWGAEMAYTVQVTFAKLSILFFYVRIGGPHAFGLPRWFLVSTYAIMALTTLVCVGSEIFLIFRCKPFDYQWNQMSPGAKGRCWDPAKFFFINAGLNIFLDIVITILPMPLLLGLDLPRRQKIGLCGIFALGGLVCAISVVRVAQLPALNRSVDVTWDVTDAITWYYIESTLIIIAACGPSFKPFCRRHIPFLLSSPKNTDGSDSVVYDGANRTFGGGYNLATLPHTHQPSNKVSSAMPGGINNKHEKKDSEECIIGDSMRMGIMRPDVILPAESHGEC